jgi:hypothetical protein
MFITLFVNRLCIELGLVRPVNNVREAPAEFKVAA